MKIKKVEKLYCTKLYYIMLFHLCQNYVFLEKMCCNQNQKDISCII